MAWQPTKKQQQIIECIEGYVSQKKLQINYRLIDKLFTDILQISEKRLKFIAALECCILW